ncbi:MAG: lipoprotein [bacterium P201]|nr:MAG: lipoprotein [bacterium P201]
MKQFLNYLLFVMLGLFVAGCQKDNIVLIDPINTEEDDITNIEFSQTVYVTYSLRENASVTGANEDFTVTISGNDVTIVYSGDEYVMYELSGSTNDGFFKLYSTKKQCITLNGVNITNPNGAAINVQGTVLEPNKGKRTFVVVNGDNTLFDGETYSDTPSGEDEKATFFSEGQLIFSGSGTLSVDATGKSGIASDDYIVIQSGSINVSVSSNAYYDETDDEYKSPAGIKTNDYFSMKGGSLVISSSGTGCKGISSDGNGYFSGGSVGVVVTGSNHGSSGGWGGNSSDSKSAKGMKFDGDLYFSGSHVFVNCRNHEGIEAKGALTISDGEVYSTSSADDAINSGGDFTISGGYVCGYSSGNDGLDANGNFYIKGGVVYAIGARSPEVAIDANSEGGYQLYLTGGTLVAIGGLESGSSLTQSCYSASSYSTSTWHALTVGAETYAFMTPSSGGTPLVVSGGTTPTLQSGVTVLGGTTHFESWFYTDPSVSGGNSVSLSSYTGGNGGGGGPGGGGHGPF